MSLGSRWRRFDAEHWIYRLGMLQTTLLALVTAWVVMAAVLAGVLGHAVFAVVPGLFASLVGWLTAAWGRDERWSWAAWAWVSGVGGVFSAATLASGRPGGGTWAGLVLATLTLVLLFHPDSRARWLARPAAGAQLVTRSGDTRADAGGRPPRRS